VHWPPTRFTYLPCQLVHLIHSRPRFRSLARRFNFQNQLLAEELYTSLALVFLYTIHYTLPSLNESHDYWGPFPGSGIGYESSFSPRLNPEPGSGVYMGAVGVYVVLQHITSQFARLRVSTTVGSGCLLAVLVHGDFLILSSEYVNFSMQYPWSHSRALHVPYQIIVVHMYIHHIPLFPAILVIQTPRKISPFQSTAVSPRLACSCMAVHSHHTTDHK
jgi:hypothetical protein